MQTVRPVGPGPGCGRRGRAAGAVLSAAVALVLAACGAGAGGAGGSPGGAGTGAGGGPAPDEVTVGVVPIVDVAPLYLGDRQGFFGEQGITVRFETGQGGAAIVPGVVSGQLDVGFSNVTSLLLARSQGLRLRIVAGASRTTGEPGNDYTAVVVPADSAVTDAAGITGTVAVNTLNNIGDTTVRQAVASAGGDPAGIRFVELPFPDMPAALALGRVDAAWVTEPFLTIAKGQGAREVASPYAVTHPNLMVAAYFTSEELLASDPDLVRRFAAAVEASLEHAQADPDAVREVLGSYTEIDDSVAAAIVLPRWSADVDEETVTLLADLARRDGLLTADPDIAGLLP